MNEENMKKFHPELAEYYQKGDCCTWIVELRKQVSEKDKEIERLNNIINELENYLEDKNEFFKISTMGYSYGVVKDILDKLKELKESNNNE